MIDRPQTFAKLVPAIDYIHPIEGYRSDSPTDRGGATKWGISLRFLNLVSEGDINGDGHVDEHDVWAMTEEDKFFFYEKYFWRYYRLGELRDQQVANRIFSIFINFRGQDAAKIVQLACRSNLKRLAVDGIMGSETIRCINSATPQSLLAALRSEQASMYHKIVNRFPDQVANLEGWIRRAYRY